MCLHVSYIVYTIQYTLVTRYNVYFSIRLSYYVLLLLILIKSFIFLDFYRERQLIVLNALARTSDNLMGPFSRNPIEIKHQMYMYSIHILYTYYNIGTYILNYFTSCRH